MKSIGSTAVVTQPADEGEGGNGTSVDGCLLVEGDYVHPDLLDAGVLSRNSQGDKNERRAGEVDLNVDRALVQRCQNGDPDAFKILYTHYYYRVYLLCLKWLGNNHDAEDTCQEAFTRAWKGLPYLRGEKRFYPWLSVIASNLCIDNLRKRSHLILSGGIEQVCSHAQQPIENSVEEKVMSDVDADIAAMAFNRLCERHRKILRMREQFSWSYQRIAEHENISIEAVQTLLWRARQALKREFSFIADDSVIESGIGVGAFAGILIAIRQIPKSLHRHISKLALHAKLAAGVSIASVATGTIVGAVVIAHSFMSPQLPQNTTQLSPVVVQQNISNATTSTTSQQDNHLPSPTNDASTTSSTFPKASRLAQALEKLTQIGLPTTLGTASMTGTVSSTTSGVIQKLNTTLNTTTGTVSKILNQASQPIVQQPASQLPLPPVTSPSQSLNSAVSGVSNSLPQVGNTLGPLG